MKSVSLIFLVINIYIHCLDKICMCPKRILFYQKVLLAFQLINKYVHVSVLQRGMTCRGPT